MKPSDAVVSFIKVWEGFRSEPYKCLGGEMTIGYGHVIKSGEKYTKITKEKATELLKKDLQSVEKDVNSLCKSNNVKLTQQEFDSLVSFTFNLGIGNLKKSELFRNIKNGVRDKNKLKENFKVWRMAGGKVVAALEKRRIDEWQMFFYGDYKRDN